MVAAGVAATLGLRRSRLLPAALVLLGGGLALGAWSAPDMIRELSPRLPDFSLLFPTGAQWIEGVLYAGIPQLPLTLLNSVLAVCVLSGDLFPGRRVPERRMAVSVGLMNLSAVWFGAMPMCHGSGGLAAQYYFGARTGGGVVMVGILKLALGLLLGTAAMSLLALIPQAVLAVFLLFAGYQLALPARDQKGIAALAVVIPTAAGIVLINTLVGFLVGMAVHLLIRYVWRRPLVARSPSR